MTAAAGAVTAAAVAALIATTATAAGTIMFACMAHYILNADNILLNNENTS